MAPTVTMSSTLMVRPRPSAFLIFANTATTAAPMNSHAARGTVSIHRPTGAGRRIGSTTPRLFISNLSATKEANDVAGHARRQEEFEVLERAWPATLASARARPSPALGLSAGFTPTAGRVGVIRPRLAADTPPVRVRCHSVTIRTVHMALARSLAPGSCSDWGLERVPARALGS